MGVGFGCGVSVGWYGGFMGLKFGCGVSVRGYGGVWSIYGGGMGFPMGKVWGFYGVE